MSKKTIIIDQSKCVGCGICANTCKQSAIEMVDGKAQVVRKDSCDGIGNCLPVCPVGAISFAEREVATTPVVSVSSPSQCPSLSAPQQSTSYSALQHWPVQIKLVPTTAAYFANAHLLIAADCTAYSYSNFHQDFMAGKVTLIGCPKLDMVDYTEKLTEILENNSIQSVTVARMEVPCCGGIERATITALKNSGKIIPCNITTLSLDGRIL